MRGFLLFLFTFCLMASFLEAEYSVKIYPQDAKIQVGDTIMFTAIICTPSNTVYSSRQMKWAADGGKNF